MRSPRHPLAFLALVVLVAACASQAPQSEAPRSSAPAAAAVEPGAVVMDDFESGGLGDWRTVQVGRGAWLVYRDGQVAPDPSVSDPEIPFDVADPPQGEHAAVTDMNGPGTRILYRDVRLDGSFVLHLNVFHQGSQPFATPDTLAFDWPDANQQFRIDLVDPSAPIDSVAVDDILASVFLTRAGDAIHRQPAEVTFDVSPWSGTTVRLRLAQTDNQGPLRAGVDFIRFVPASGDGGRVEFPDTPAASPALTSEPASASPSG